MFERQCENKQIFLDRVNELIGREQAFVFESLYKTCSLSVAKAVSKAERSVKKLTDKSLVYGEVEYDAFECILKKATKSRGRGGIFYDLGAGSGRPVLIARIAMDFDKCIGIEYLKGLHDAACKIKRQYDKEYLPILHPDASKGQVEFLRARIQDVDWSDGDVCFANSTCFDSELVDEISKLAEKLKPGSIFITFTKKLPSLKFQLVFHKRYRMTWGPATVFIHQKLG